MEASRVRGAPRLGREGRLQGWKVPALGGFQLECSEVEKVSRLDGSKAWQVPRFESSKVGGLQGWRVVSSESSRVGGFQGCIVSKFCWKVPKTESS